MALSAPMPGAPEVSGSAEGADDRQARAHVAFMLEALEEAQQAADIGEVPVGAVVVHGGQVIARAHNTRELDNDPTAHAELVAMRMAAELLGDWRLTDCTLYVTLEPCFMCAGAIVNARVGTVVYGASDPKAGAVESLASVLADARLNHRPAVTGGIEATRCGDVLRAFFRARRKGGALGTRGRPEGGDGRPAPA